MERSMDSREIARQLSAIEIRTLEKLMLAQGELPDPKEAAPITGLDEDSLRRAYMWLSSKGLATISTTSGRKPLLTSKGQSAADHGLPEERMLDALSDGPLELDALAKMARLSAEEAGAALGINKRLAFVSLGDAGAKLTGLAKEFEADRRAKQELLQQTGRGIAEEANEKTTVWLSEFASRGLIEWKRTASQRLTVTTLGREVAQKMDSGIGRAFNVSEPVCRLPRGSAQPYYRFLRQVKRRLAELGFAEMDCPVITSEFYNFDVLFQPQNHPARTWTDTFSLQYPASGMLPNAKIVQAVKSAHETGGTTGSKGWRYSWDPEIAARLMPVAHGTAHSARTLALGLKPPAKLFTIARCFRPDVVDAHHLQEFNQLDGFIIGEGLTFRHLLGMLDQFAREIAHAKEVSFTPSYYPFVEPAVQLNAKHPEMGWIELGGAGIFRPEMTQNLGYKEPVIAWGLGIDRLAMFALDISDIRDLFSSDLAWLSKQPWRNL